MILAGILIACGGGGGGGGAATTGSTSTTASTATTSTTSTTTGGGEDPSKYWTGIVKKTFAFGGLGTLSIFNLQTSATIDLKTATEAYYVNLSSSNQVERSPDGKYLAWLRSEASGAVTIVVSDVRTGARRYLPLNLVDTRSPSIEDFDWSIDGLSVCAQEKGQSWYRYPTNGSPPVAITASYPRVSSDEISMGTVGYSSDYTLKASFGASGLEIRRTADNSMVGSIAGVPYASVPAISPDKSRVAFAVPEDGPQAYGGNWHLDVANVDGSGRKRVATFGFWNTRYFGPPDIKLVCRFYWSQSGQAIIHAVDKSFAPLNAGFEIVKTTLDGTTTYLTNNSVDDSLHPFQAPLGPIAVRTPEFGGYVTKYLSEAGSVLYTNQNSQDDSAIVNLSP